MSTITRIFTKSIFIKFEYIHYVESVIVVYVKIMSRDEVICIYILLEIKYWYSCSFFRFNWINIDQGIVSAFIPIVFLEK